MRAVIIYLNALHSPEYCELKSVFMCHIYIYEGAMLSDGFTSNWPVGRLVLFALPAETHSAIEHLNMVLCAIRSSSLFAAALRGSHGSHRVPSMSALTKQ